MYGIVVDLLSKTVCSGVSVYFVWVRVGLSEMQFKSNLELHACLFSPTLTQPLPLGVVVQFCSIYWVLTSVNS